MTVLIIHFKYFKFYEILFEGGRKMQKKIIGIFICMLLIATAIPVIGQVKNISINKDDNETNPTNNGDKWIKTYGGLWTDYGQMVQLTNDGCYIVAGWTMTSINDNDYWLIKIDAMGSIIWDKTYDSGRDDWCSAVRQTSDDGFILVGNTADDNYADYDIWLIKTDKNGVIEWDKTYMEGDAGPLQDVIQTGDGGYAILSGDYFEAHIIRTDDTGNIIWDKEISDLGVHGYGEYIKQTLDGGFIIAGSKQGYTGFPLVWLIKLDSDGNILWDKTFETEYGYAHSVQLTNDGGIIILGDERSDSHKGPWLIKTDSIGELIWDKKIGSSTQYIVGIDVKQTIDNGYIIAGKVLSILNTHEPFLIKTDSEGQVEWRKIYGDYSRAGFYSVQQTTDGGYIAVGAANSPVMSDILLVKTNAEGNVARNRVFTNSFLMRLFERFPNAFPILRQLLVS